MLAAVRALNRLALVTETMRHALNVLATVVPDWIRAHSLEAGLVAVDQHQTSAPLGEHLGRAGADLDAAPVIMADFPVKRAMCCSWMCRPVRRARRVLAEAREASSPTRATFQRAGVAPNTAVAGHPTQHA